MFKSRQMETEKQVFFPSHNPIPFTFSSKTQHYSSKGCHSSLPQPYNTLIKGDEALRDTANSIAHTKCLNQVINFVELLRSFDS